MVNPCLPPKKTGCAVFLCLGLGPLMLALFILGNVKSENDDCFVCWLFGTAARSVKERGRQIGNGFQKLSTASVQCIRLAWCAE